MIKSGIDQQALIDMFASASAQQATQLRQAVYQSTLGALQGRELSLKNIRKVLATVTEAASAGAAKNPLLSSATGADTEALLDNAVAGMDDALLKAVEANRVALQQLIDRGVDVREGQLKKALADLDKFEDTLFAAVKKAAAGAAEPMAGPWGDVLGKLNLGSTKTGATAASAAEQLTGQLDKVQAAVRESRAAGLKAAQTLADSYTALVSGVLMGMSDALSQGKAPAAAKRTRK